MPETPRPCLNENLNSKKTKTRLKNPYTSRRIEDAMKKDKKTKELPPANDPDLLPDSHLPLGQTMTKTNLHLSEGSSPVLIAHIEVVEFS
jgi:hypothetical protein